MDKKFLHMLTIAIAIILLFIAARNNLLIKSAINNIDRQKDFNTEIRHDINVFERNVLGHLEFQVTNSASVFPLKDGDFILVRCKSTHLTPTIMANFGGQMVSIECTSLMDP